MSYLEEGFVDVYLSENECMDKVKHEVILVYGGNLGIILSLFYMV